MNVTLWKSLSGVCFILAVCCALGVGYPLFSCSFELSEAVLKDPDPLDESLLARRVRDLRNRYEQELRPIPLSQATRVADGLAVCQSEGSAVWTGLGGASLLLVLLGFGFRHKFRVQEQEEREEKLAARRASIVPTAGIADTPRGRVASVPGIDPVPRARTSSMAAIDPDASRARTTTGPGRNTLMGVQAPARRVTQPGTNHPIAIELDEPLDLGLSKNSPEMDEVDEWAMMSFVQEKKEREDTRQAERVIVASQVGGFYCPPEFRDKPVLYVDQASRSARDDHQDKTPLNDPERPFKTLEAALKYAMSRVLKDTSGIQIRLAPGTYKSSIAVPDRVAIINHRMPATSAGTSDEEGLRQHLKWITDQPHDSTDRVTLLASPDEKFGVKFGPGALQGIFGCHIIGREGVGQVGILANGAQRLMVRACVIDGFLRGGMRLENCGTEMPGQGVYVVATQLINNAAHAGGGIFAEKSVLHVDECLIHRNKAHQGGGIFVDDAKGLVAITRTRFAHNLVASATPTEVDLRTPVESWNDLQGAGGGIFARNSKLRVIESEFVENKAGVAGGAALLLSSKVIFQGTEDTDVRMHRNEAPVGAAFAMIGVPGVPALLKYQGADVQQNMGTVGGAITLLGLVSAQFDDGKVAYNEVSKSSAFGGAFSCGQGADVVLKDLDIKENSCAGPGGAIGAVNSSVRVGEGCDLRNNVSQDSGGGVYFVTQLDTAINKLISHHGLKSPFVLAMKDCVLSNNHADDLGGGVFAGNTVAQATFPIGLRIEGTARIRNNRTRHPNEDGDDIWVVWAEETIASSRNRPDPKMLLK